MHDSEMYGRTLKVNFARPPKVNEKSQRPVWADDEWLKQYGGAAPTEGEESVDENATDSQETVDGNRPKAPKLPRVFLGIKVGIR